MNERPQGNWFESNNNVDNNSNFLTKLNESLEDWVLDDNETQSLLLSFETEKALFTIDSINQKMMILEESNLQESGNKSTLVTLLENKKAKLELLSQWANIEDLEFLLGLWANMNEIVYVKVIPGNITIRPNNWYWIIDNWNLYSEVWKFENRILIEWVVREYGWHYRIRASDGWSVEWTRPSNHFEDQETSIEFTTLPSWIEWIRPQVDNHLVQDQRIEQQISQTLNDLFAGPRLWYGEIKLENWVVSSYRESTSIDEIRSMTTAKDTLRLAKIANLINSLKAVIKEGNYSGSDFSLDSNWNFIKEWNFTFTQLVKTILWKSLPFLENQSVKRDVTIITRKTLFDYEITWRQLLNYINTIN
jgi:hypothetical protein